LQLLGITVLLFQRFFSFGGNDWHQLLATMALLTAGATLTAINSTLTQHR
jgi:hypothetical protein